LQTQCRTEIVTQQQLAKPFGDSGARMRATRPESGARARSGWTTVSPLSHNSAYSRNLIPGGMNLTSLATPWTAGRYPAFSGPLVAFLGALLVHS